MGRGDSCHLRGPNRLRSQPANTAMPMVSPIKYSMTTNKLFIFLFWRKGIEREIQRKHIHTRLSENAQARAVGIGADEFAHLVLA
jgi:hypothetical protein